MISVILSAEFEAWLEGLRDVRAQARIAERLFRMSQGNPGDVKSVGEGVSEARITYGPGYRLYFVRRGATLIFLLCGGDKSPQRRDIARAKALASNLKE